MAPGVVGGDETLVPKMRWNELAGIAAIVGSCRECALHGRHGDLVALAPSAHDHMGEDGEVTWYEARCRACGKEVAAPNGRVMRRSSRHTETPRGWLERRAGRDEEQVKQRAGYDPDGHPAGRTARRGRSR